MRYYKPGTTKIYSYLCARSTKKENEALFFGLQPYLELLERPISQDDADEFFMYWAEILGGPAPADVTEKINALVKLGYLPLEIKAVPEGTVIENKNVLATITNTHPDFPWAVGFFESLLLKVWAPTTVATLSLKFKRLLTNCAAQTSDSEFLVPFLVHDFGYRGVSSEQSAEILGAAHLTCFTGSDNIPGIKFAKTAYKAEGFIAGSVPASEHSVMCSYGPEGELEAFKRMLELNPTGLVSIVSDTYNFWDVMTKFTVELKEEILARDGKVVFRPDSGDPLHILCGNPEAPVGSPEFKGAIRILDEIFGSTVNSKGFKELNSKVGLIYGDGMYYDRVVRIMETMMGMGYATTTVVLGIGGLLLQQHNRDDLGFAIKATYAEINGEAVELFKDPITDPGKKSHTGLLKLIQDQDGKFHTVQQCTPEQEQEGQLTQVYLNGKVTKRYSLNEIRQRVDKV
jgi:nicotinamide phosphoribosyltransferase